MNFVEEMRSKAKSDPRRLVLPEGYEPRTMKAGRLLLDGGYAKSVTLLGAKAAIEAEAAKQGVSLKGFEIEEPATAAMAASVAGVAIGRTVGSGLCRS